MEINQQAYSSKEVVEKYAHFNTLQKGEVKVFEKYRDKIKTGKVLDIGIGGGRTTAYLVTQAQEYVGVDFSQPFLDHCQAKFGSLPNATFQYADARDMKALKDDDFDFILFSYNGIDCVDFDGREKILAECTRLLKKGGILCFSFHNTRNLDMLYSFQYPRNPFKYTWEWRRMHKVRDINGDKEKYRNKDWFIIKDGCEDFTTDIFYAEPTYQQRCLEAFGFNTFHFYESQSGKELSGVSLTASETPWIYISAIKS